MPGGVVHTRDFIMVWALWFNVVVLVMWRFFGDWPPRDYFLCGLVAVALLISIDAHLTAKRTKR